MENYVITIARETGSGGHNITRKLSDALAIPYYDRDLLRMASEVSGIHERLFGAADERIGMKEMLSAAESISFRPMRSSAAPNSRSWMPLTSEALRSRSRS